MSFTTPVCSRASCLLRVETVHRQAHLNSSRSKWDMCRKVTASKFMAGPQPLAVAQAPSTPLHAQMLFLKMCTTAPAQTPTKPINTHTRKLTRDKDGSNQSRYTQHAASRSRGRLLASSRTSQQTAMQAAVRGRDGSSCAMGGVWTTEETRSTTKCEKATDRQTVETIFAEGAAPHETKAQPTTSVLPIIVKRAQEIYSKESKVPRPRREPRKTRLFHMQ